MIDKLKQKINNMTTKDWILVSLWLLTLILLLVFVILAATLPKDAGTITVHHEAGNGITKTFPAASGKAPLDVIDNHYTVQVVLDSSIGKYIVSNPAFDSVAKGSTYANTLASVGGVFVLGLFASLVTTVIFASKKGGK